MLNAYYTIDFQICVKNWKYMIILPGSTLTPWDQVIHICNAASENYDNTGSDNGLTETHICIYELWFIDASEN